jgi:dipeptidyl-peptidase 4
VVILRRLVPAMRLLILIAAALATARASAAQAQNPVLSTEWIYGEQGSRVAEVPDFAWLADGSAILYDTRLPEAQRTFEKLDPATGARHPLVDMAQAVASLNSLAKDASSGTSLPWPAAFDNAGRQAVYIFHGDIFLLDLASSQFTRVTNTSVEEKDPAFSPNGQLLSFVRANDIYVYDIAAKKEIRLTQDGSETTLNGTLSWVYWEEVFGRRDLGYWWSPDSRAIAYLQTDDSLVSVSTFVDFAPVDQRIIHQPYPKPGEHNPRVRVGIAEIASTATTWVTVSDKPYEWIQHIQWLPDSNRVSLETLNRPQTELRLYFADRKTGAATRILTDSDPAWINVSDDLFFLADHKHFLFASERDGYMHLYRYLLDGTLVNQVTKGDWAIVSSGGLPFWVRQAVVGIDEKNDWIYFTSIKDSSIERQLYRVHADGTGLTRLSKEAGAHRIAMSPDTRFYFDRYSNIRTLPSLRLFDSNGSVKSTLAAPRPELLPAGMQYPELLTIPAADGFPMPAQVLKPKDFDPSHKYPVILYVYGGPSAPTVVDAWQPSVFANNLLLKDGYLVVGMDNRVATAISKKLENAMAPNPGDSETADIVAGIRWLKSQSWVDPARVGIWGWSGGGTMTLNVMTRSKEIKAGIAGAPVTDWRYYDSKWAESLLKLPQDNPEGYARASLVNHAADLSGHVMFIFGTYDDNVHPQNEQAFMNELIKAGIPYEVMIYPMRKHGFTDVPARIHRDLTMRAFWKNNL